MCPSDVLGSPIYAKLAMRNTNKSRHARGVNTMFCTQLYIQLINISDYNNDQDLWERRETYYYTYWISCCKLIIILLYM